MDFHGHVANWPHNNIWLILLLLGFALSEQPEAAPGAAMAGELEGFMVTQEGLATVTEHLATFEEYAPDQAMISRLSSQVGSTATGADANFYTHELMESELMSSGMDYDAAHAAALEQAGLSPFAVYAPEVIQQFPEEFGPGVFNYWGLR